MGLDYFKAYHRYLNAICNLTDSECGRLFRALLERSAGDTPNNLKGRESVAYDFIAAEIDEEAAKYKELCEKNRANGSQNKRSLPSALEKKKEKKQKKEENNNTPYSPPKGDGEFAEFWKAYPRKAGKQNAERAFAKVDVPLETLLAALEAQKRTQQWQDEKYIPHASTWLNGKRWEDETNALPQLTEEIPKPRRFVLDANGFPVLVEE